MRRGDEMLNVNGRNTLFDISGKINSTSINCCGIEIRVLVLSFTLFTFHLTLYRRMIYKVKWIYFSGGFSFIRVLLSEDMS